MPSLSPALCLLISDKSFQNTVQKPNCCLVTPEHHLPLPTAMAALSREQRLGSEEDKMLILGAWGAPKSTCLQPAGLWINPSHRGPVRSQSACYVHGPIGPRWWENWWRADWDQTILRGPLVLCSLRVLGVSSAQPLRSNRFPS